MKKISLMVCAMLAQVMAFAATTICDMKVTPIPPWGLAIDYTVSGADDDHDIPLMVSAIAGGVTNVALNLMGETNCVNGAHRVYWNLAEEGIERMSNATIQVQYSNAEAQRKSEQFRYCIVDLSGENFGRSYSQSSPLRGNYADEIYKTTKLLLKRVAPGSYIMGEDQTNEAHRVTITKPFYMGVFELTQCQWLLIMKSNPCPGETYNHGMGNLYPVYAVSYDRIRGSYKGLKWPYSKDVDIDSFMGNLRAKSGIEFDLPTEAQWEYACRAGTDTVYSYGNNADGDYMWSSENSSAQAHEVGMKKANPWGFYDMYGNAEEWCLDWSCAERAYGVDPVGGVPSSSSGYRMVRGALGTTPLPG